MRIFLIRPIRNASPTLALTIMHYIKVWEREGHKVYEPGRDTPQQARELDIASANREAICAADEVRVIWDARTVSAERVAYRTKDKHNG